MRYHIIAYDGSLLPCMVFRVISGIINYFFIDYLLGVRCMELPAKSEVSKLGSRFDATSS